jgi:hypothetical protein
MTHMIRVSCLTVVMLIGYAQAQSVVLDRDGSTIVFEPYRPTSFA